MQKEIESGKKLTKKLVEQTCVSAGANEMSGFSEGCAKQALISCWSYGLLLGKVLGTEYEKIIENRRTSGLKNARLLKM